MRYDCQGDLISKEKKERNQGTQVQVSKLFESLPVRLCEFKKTYKLQFQKCLALLQQYALVNTHVTFRILNSAGDKLPFNQVLRT